MSSNCLQSGTRMIKFGHIEIDVEGRALRKNGETVQIGARAFDILARLASANGELVTKDELMNAVWPDTVVEENNIQVHLSVLRKALGDERERIVTVPGRGYRLVQRRSFDPPLASNVQRPARRSMPRRLTELLGRDEAVEQICTALRQHSVLTLTGAGGIGKTALSIAVAHRLAYAQPDSVAFVELAALTDKQAVVAAIAQCCAMPAGSESPSIEEVAATLADAEQVFVLDNAEHLIAVVAEIVDTLVARNPRLRVLVTSREPLRITPEAVFRVDPLDVPPHGASEDETLARSAVRLFLARVKALKGQEGEGCDGEQLRVAGAICRRLDGIPLAIELAAARVSSFGIEGVYRRLDDRMSILTSGYRTALPRHKTLRATFDWSFALLDPAAQMLFRRLAMFGGVFTLEALCAVVCDTRVTIGTVIDSIGELVEKSMLNIEFDGPVAKYRLSESTRAYALEHLQAQGEAPEMASRMARYLASRFETGTSGSGPIGPSSDVRQSLGYARSACDWALSADGDSLLAVKLTSTMVSMLLECCLIDECGRRAARALSVLDELPARSVDALTEMRIRAALAAALPNLTGPIERSGQLWQEVLDLAVASDNDEFQARAFWGLWNAALYGGKVHEAFELAIRFQKFGQHRGHSWQVTLATQLAAVAQHCRGEHADAKLQIESTMLHLAANPDEAQRIGRLAVDPLAICYSTLARIVCLQGDQELAIAYVDKLVNLIKPETMEPWLTHVLGVVAVPIALIAADMRRANHYLEIMRSQAALHDFTIWQEYSDCLAGYRDLLAGKTDAGLSMLETSLDPLMARGFRRLITPLTVARAEALIGAGRLEEASVRLHDELDFCRRNGKMFFVPEVFRALGLLALAQADLAPHTSAARHDALSRAKANFIDAMQMAQAHGARMLELRATVAMARMLHAQEETAAAIALLKPLSTGFERASRSPDVRALYDLISVLHGGDEQDFPLSAVPASLAD